MLLQDVIAGPIYDCFLLFYNEKFVIVLFVLLSLTNMFRLWIENNLTGFCYGNSPWFHIVIVHLGCCSCVHTLYVGL